MNRFGPYPSHNLRRQEYPSFNVDGTLYLCLDGEPISQKRPRVTGKTFRAYNPNAKDKKEDRKQIFIQIKEIGFTQTFNCPVSVGFEFQFTAPKKYSDKIGCYYANVKDIDNLQKYYLDVLNAIVYDDDRYVCYVSSRKILSDTPRTLIAIREIK